MGIFTKLFGSDETPPSEAAPTGDPYRGAAYVEVPHATPAKPLPPIAPRWDSWTRILDVERGGEFPLGAIVYDGENDGQQVVRRVSFHPNGAVIDWEAPITRDQLSDHLVVCVDERVLIPRVTGLVAIHPKTGQVCWELPHPAALKQQPVQFPDGDLLLVFADRSWLRLAPSDGAFRAEGTVRTEDDAEKLVEQCREIAGALGDSTTYGGRSVRALFDGLRVGDDDEPSTSDRPAPTEGDYPIDEWKADELVTLFDDKLVVWLEKSWDGETSGAIGLFEPTSLEPLRLIELGPTSINSAYRVGDFLVVSAKKSERYTSLVVDIANERVLAAFVEDSDSSLFDHAGELVWRAAI